MNVEEASLPYIGENCGWLCMGGGSCIKGIEVEDVLLRLLVVVMVGR